MENLLGFMSKLQIWSTVNIFAIIAVVDFNRCNCVKTLHTVLEIRKCSIQCRGMAAAAHSIFIVTSFPSRKVSKFPKDRMWKSAPKYEVIFEWEWRKSLPSAFKTEQFIQLNKKLKAALQGSQHFGDAVKSWWLPFVAVHLRAGGKHDFHSQLFLFFSAHKHALLLKVKSSA